MAPGGVGSRPGRRRAEWLARLLVVGLALGLPAALLIGRWLSGRGVIEIHARIAEAGGFTPPNLTVEAGQALKLRLVSDDMLHGFAVGQQAAPNVDLPPGKPVETTLVFDQPGTYVFYCTRWCGLGHWRMRGTIEVLPAAGTQAVAPGDPANTAAAPLYAQLGIDLDAPHPTPPEALPPRRPSAPAGASLAGSLPAGWDAGLGGPAQSPAAAWQALRAQNATADLDNAAVWDQVAWVWRQQTTPAQLAEGQALYAQNCAACHGEQGGGDGVMAPALEAGSHAAEEAFGTHTVAPTDFTDPAQMLGASPALLHGKIVRGGMGTGMPYWGPILTDDQVWSLIAHLWTFTLD